MSEENLHPYVPKLVKQFSEGRVSRRDFLRTATLLGLSAAAAYAVVGRVTGESLTDTAQAQEALPKGGTLRIGAIVHEVSNPHTFFRFEQSNVARQVCDYLTVTGHDNITRPWMLENWVASDDLKTWTLNLRKDIRWHNGRPFLADDVVWNLKHVLDPATGSSMVGAMKGYLLDEYETGDLDEAGKPNMSVRLWDASAIERVDDHTVRLNCKKPHLAVPEDLFAYPMPILDPEEKGEFGPGSNGTGAFELVEHLPGQRSVLRARDSYWAGPVYLDRLEFIDLGEDAGAGIAALSSSQVDGLTAAGITQYQVLQNSPDLQFYQVPTASTAIVRGKISVKPFDDVRVRRAMQLATDTRALLELAYRGVGLPGEFHHVAPVHPEYAPLPPIRRDVEQARQLLAEAGYPNGLDLKIDTRSDPDWFVITVQGLAEQWKEAGIRLNINVMPSAQYSEIWNKTPFGITDWFHRPLGVQTLSLAYRSGVPWNESEYANPEFDRLLDEAEATLDVEKRRAIMAEIEKIMQADAPAIQPFWRSVFTFHHKRVKGFKMHPTQYIFGHQLAVDR